MRDTIKDRAYFETYLTENDEFARQLEIRATDPERDYKKRLGSSFNLYSERSHIAIATYSIGAPVSEVKARVVEALAALELVVSLGEQDVDYFIYGDGGGYAGGFDEWYRLLAWCILFDLPSEQTSIVSAYLRLQTKNPKTPSDLLLDRMSGYFDNSLVSKGESLLWPGAYTTLNDCFSDPTSNKHLVGFVKGWLAKMRTTSWHNNHKNRHNVYFGYWCFEAAAVAKMLNLNDAFLRQHPNYPYDARHL